MAAFTLTSVCWILWTWWGWGLLLLLFYLCWTSAQCLHRTSTVYIHHWGFSHIVKVWLAIVCWTALEPAGSYTGVPLFISQSSVSSQHTSVFSIKATLVSQLSLPSVCTETEKINMNTAFHYECDIGDVMASNRLWFLGSCWSDILLPTESRTLRRVRQQE